MRDLSCLAENYVVSADSKKTGINKNEIVVGPTGCGKSFSNAYSRLVHTYDSSVVVPIAKKEIKEKFAQMFRERGYEVIDQNFANPEECEIGYDPLDYIHSEEDAIQTASNLVGQDPVRSRTGGVVDPYWNETGASVLAAEIGLIRLNAKDTGRRPCFADVLELHRSIVIDASGNTMKTNLDAVFERAAKEYPGNQASELWKTFKENAPKTASCIFSIVNNAIDKVFTENALAMTKKENRINFKELGERKIALFITTSPMNKSLQNLINLLYADMFRELFESAEKVKESKFTVPVHIICDDFACGGRIPDFEDYISIFRGAGAGISVTLLLQSESQLCSMYGEQAATTIINNCDTYVYMGGMDIETCKHISQRIEKPASKIMRLPLEQVIVFRRGQDPVISRRYQILNDPEYRKIMKLDEEQREIG